MKRTQVDTNDTISKRHKTTNSSITINDPFDKVK